MFSHFNAKISNFDVSISFEFFGREKLKWKQFLKILKIHWCECKKHIFRNPYRHGHPNVNSDITIWVYIRMPMSVILIMNSLRNVNLLNWSTCLMFIAVIFVETYKIDINICLCQKNLWQILKRQENNSIQ